MNNYYELKHLTSEFRQRLKGSTFKRSISPHKEVLESYIEAQNELKRLIFSANSAETALFLDDYRPPKKSNVIDFFTILEGSEITDVTLAHHDRLLYLEFGNDYKILFKLYGNNPNALLIRGGQVTDSFKNPDRVKGESPPQPNPPAFADSVNEEMKAKNQLTKLNPLLPRNLLPDLIEQHNVESMSANEVIKFVREISGKLKNDPHPRVLITGETCLWSESVLAVDTERSFKTVNHCILHAYRNAVHRRRLHRKKDRILNNLGRVESRLESRIKELENAEKSLERAEQYEQYGHILMANVHKSVNRGTDEIVLENFYEGGEKITIPLKIDKDMAGNAKYYYEKAKSSKKSYRMALERLKKSKKELSRVKKLMSQLEEVKSLPELEAWIKDHNSNLKQFGYGDTGDDQAASPYRKTRSGKYEIWIGKSAKSNDELLSLAHKEDIWLHARGVPGSHAVIRMGNSKDFPPKEVILHAASYAAYYSKARGMKTAPVMYTKVKYVRKPKGSAPGAVTLEREKVEMVPPMKPQN